MPKHIKLKDFSRSNSIVFLLLVLINLIGCTSEKEHDHEGDNATYTCPMHPQVVQKAPGTCPICHMDLVKVDASETAENEIMLSESQMQLANIHTALPNNSSAGTEIILKGEVIQNEDLSQMISSRIGGRIEKLYFKEIGQFVSKNQPLYSIYSEDLLTYQQEFLMALEQVETIDSSSERYQSLLRAARKKLSLYGLSEVQIKSLEENKEVKTSFSFLAPSSGFITEINALDGNYVEEGAPLFRVVALDPAWIEAELYQSEMNLLEIGDSVEVQLMVPGNQPLKGEVVFLSPEYRAGSQITLARITVPNKHNVLTPGMQANIRVNTSANQALTIPANAVIRDEAGNHVWIQKGDMKFIAKPVQIGQENASEVEIIQGLTEKDTVVISGAYLLYSEFVLKKGGDPMAQHHHSN